MASRNIWEVKNINDFAYLLKHNFTVVAGLVLSDNTEQQKITMRKFLKEKSKKFYLITFVYFKVPKEILGSFGIIKEDKKLYPILYHIRESEDVVAWVFNADWKSMVNCFNAMEKYYLKEMEKYECENQKNPENNENDENQDSLENPENSENQENKKVDKLQVPNEPDPMTEKKKHLEKCKVIIDKYESEKEKFIKEIGNRKKILENDEKISKKEKKKKNK
jgi:hypothetical protein